MLTRRKFIRDASASSLAFWLPLIPNGGNVADVIMTVKGPVSSDNLNFTLSHEHVLVDFIGADKVSPDRYDIDDVFNTALPFLKDVKRRGCATMVECTPAYLGRDVRLLRRLSDASGLHILTNTGYYGAVGEKYLPQLVYTETAEQIASRWIKEWNEGIDGTGVKPGFIKTSVDKAPLSLAQRKIIEAAAITHLATGLTIGVHTGDGPAAEEQLDILAERGVAPAARIWIHAQNEKNKQYHFTAAKIGSWVSFDGVNADSALENVAYLKAMKQEKLLHRVLVSQDSGYYHIGEPKGGDYKDYNYIFTGFIPLLKQNGFTTADINTLFIANPAKAFSIRVRTI